MKIGRLKLNSLYSTYGRANIQVIKLKSFGFTDGSKKIRGIRLNSPDFRYGRGKLQVITLKIGKEKKLKNDIEGCIPESRDIKHRNEAVRISISAWGGWNRDINFKNKQTKKASGRKTYSLLL